MFIGWLKDLGFEDVTMTTNGFLLKENLEGLVEAGLDRVNISLDTLQPEKFAFITQAQPLREGLGAVMAAAGDAALAGQDQRRRDARRERR